MIRTAFAVVILTCLMLQGVACGGRGTEAPAEPTAGAAAPTAGGGPSEAAAPGAASAPSEAPRAAAASPESYPRGLLVALAQFEVSPEGKALPKPKAARLEILLKRAGKWDVTAIEDAESNVFHKAMVYDPGSGGPGILTLGGTAGVIKLWRKGPGGFMAETLWKKDFGGKFSRMREAEVGDIFGDRSNVIAVGTHDQGVVALVRPRSGAWDVTEIDHEKDTFVHEVEIGDLDGDGILEVYATPSEPNRLDGTPQPGKVVRYVPAKKEGRKVVADLGDRHAKEILVSDVDGDGRDEMYVSVEAVSGGQLEIRRYDAGTDPAGGTLIAVIPDTQCRFLTPGDIDRDGRKEMVAAAYKTGLWLLSPGADPKARWKATSIDSDSSGFEHAAILTDLDGDGADELYVASDDQGEIRRYDWRDGKFSKEVLLRRQVPKSVFTWNLMPVPASLIQ